jgi:segregation and condensation protein B
LIFWGGLRYFVYFVTSLHFVFFPGTSQTAVRKIWGRLNYSMLLALLRDWLYSLVRFWSSFYGPFSATSHGTGSLNHRQEKPPSSNDHLSRSASMREMTPLETELLNPERVNGDTPTVGEVEPALDAAEPAYEDADPGEAGAVDVTSADGDFADVDSREMGSQPVSAVDVTAEDGEDVDEGPALEDPALIPLVSLLESLLFVAEEPVEPARLAQALDRTIAEVDAGMLILQERYEQENRGIRLQRRSGRVQLVTNPAAAAAVETFLNLDLSTRLSGPALETLAVIAYQQPVTRAQIEAVRGVDCSGVLRKLQQQGLVEEAGRLEAVGRPILYGVTDLFMQHFGLTSLNELPELPEIDADTLAAVVELVEEEG